MTRKTFTDAVTGLSLPYLKEAEGYQKPAYAASDRPVMRVLRPIGSVLGVVLIAGIVLTFAFLLPVLLPKKPITPGDSLISTETNAPGDTTPLSPDLRYAEDPVKHWPENGEYPAVTLPEFPGVSFTRDTFRGDGGLDADGEAVIEGKQKRVRAFRSSDLNGDGYPELFVITNVKHILWSEVDDIVIYDYHAGKQLLKYSAENNTVCLSFAVWNDVLYFEEITDSVLRTGRPACREDGTVFIEWLGETAVSVEKAPGEIVSPATPGLRYATPAAKRWSGEASNYNFIQDSYEMQEFPGVTFRFDPKSGKLTANGGKIVDGCVASFWSSDLTGDGYPELFLVTVNDDEWEEVRHRWISFDEESLSGEERALLEQIKEDRVRYNKEKDERFRDSVSISWYVRYGDAVACWIYDGYDVSPAEVKDTVAGSHFHYFDSQAIEVWKDGNFYTMEEAFDEGILTLEQVAKIAHDFANSAAVAGDLVIYDYHAGREILRQPRQGDYIRRFALASDWTLYVAETLPSRFGSFETRIGFPACREDGTVFIEWVETTPPEATPPETTPSDENLYFAHDAVQHWPDKGWNYPDVTLPEFPGVTFAREADGTFLVNGKPLDFLEEINLTIRTEAGLAVAFVGRIHVIGFSTSDLNGDGYPELCLLTDDLHQSYLVYDYHNSRKLAQLWWYSLAAMNRTELPGDYLYTVFAENGGLVIDKTTVTKGRDERDLVNHGRFACTSNGEIVIEWDDGTVRSASDHGPTPVAAARMPEIGCLTIAHDAVQHWPDKDGNFPAVTLPEFPGVSFTIKDEVFRINGTVPDFLFRRGYVVGFYSSDLNGDGYPELIVITSKTYGRFTWYLTIYDYHNKKDLLYVCLAEDYIYGSLLIENGTLCLEEGENGTGFSGRFACTESGEIVIVCDDGSIHDIPHAVLPVEPGEVPQPETTPPETTPSETDIPTTVGPDTRPEETAPSETVTPPVTVIDPPETEPAPVVHAAYSEGLRILPTSDGTACYVFSRGTCRDSILVIPPSYNGMPVTAIGDQAFENDTTLTGIVIPDSVMSIGWAAFRGCSRLIEITIPDSVTGLGHCAFSDCEMLESVTLGKGVTVLNDNTFQRCRSLRSVTFRGDLTEIGYCAFAVCTDLSHISLPNTVTRIGEQAFSFTLALQNVTLPTNLESIGEAAFISGGLTSVTIPKRVTSIEVSPFYDCPSLTSISVEPGNIAYYSEGNCLIRQSDKALIAGCRNSVIPDDVTSIGDCVFLNLDNSVSRIRIPVSVTKIGFMSFAGTCLTGIDYAGTKAQWEAISKDGSEEGFEWNSGNPCPIYCTDGVIGGVSDHSEKLAFALSDDGKSYVVTGFGSVKDSYLIIPSSYNGKPVTGIAENAFSQTYSLMLVNIPDSVQWIGDRAFENCELLTNVNIPNSVVSIGRSAFAGCKSLVNVVIPDGTVEIGEKAFANCQSLMTVNLYPTVKKIGSGAFSNCSSLRTVEIQCFNLHEIEERVFEHCTELTEITLPEHIVKIGEGAFYGCSRLSNVTIPSGVAEIEPLAFCECDMLASITYGWTISHWQAVIRGRNGTQYKDDACVIRCTDGTVAE